MAPGVFVSPARRSRLDLEPWLSCCVAVMGQSSVTALLLFVAKRATVPTKEAARVPVPGVGTPGTAVALPAGTPGQGTQEACTPAGADGLGAFPSLVLQALHMASCCPFAKPCAPLCP